MNGCHIIISLLIILKKSNLGSSTETVAKDVKASKETLGFGIFKEKSTDINGITATSCKDFASSGLENGTYAFRLSSGRILHAHCSWHNGRSYTLVQRRGQYGNSINYFFREWKAYERGFGEQNEEYWLGLENLRELTSLQPMDMIITLYDQKNQGQILTLQNLTLGSNTTSYKLYYKKVLTANMNLLGSIPRVGSPFSTWDNDVSPKCASLSKGPWWFRRNECFTSNLNGLNLGGTVSKDYSEGLGIIWASLSGLHYSIKKTLITLTDHDPSKETIKPPPLEISIPEENKSYSKKQVPKSKESPKHKVETTLDVSNLLSPMSKKNVTSIISHLPTISYEAVFCKDAPVILGCGNKKGVLRVIETSLVQDCGPKGNRKMKHDDCYSIRGNAFLGHLKNECNGKPHCMIGSNDKLLQRKSSCKDQNVGINVVFVCTNMKIPSINGTKSIDRDYKLRYSIDRRASTDDKYYYNSANESASWILIDLKSYTPVSSIVITFHNNQVNASELHVASYNRPVEGNSLQDRECLLSNEMINNRTIRATCETLRRGRFIWMQMKGSFQVDEIFVRLKPDSFVDDCLVPHKTVDLKDSMDTFKSIPLENCRELCGLLSKCIGFSYNLEVGTCHLSNISRTIDATEFNVVGRKDCIEDVREHVLQRECRHESTRASGHILREYPSVATVNLCYSICQQLKECSMFTHDQKLSKCTLFESAELSKRNHDAVTGDKTCDGNILDCFVYEAEYMGTEIDVVKNVPNIQSCQKLCQHIPYCFFWSYLSDQEECRRKSSVRKIMQRSFATSGSRNCKSSVIKNVEFIGQGSLHKYIDIHTSEGCRQKCQEDYQCSVWSLYATSRNKSLQICETRHSYSDIGFNHGCQSGFKWRMFMPRNVEAMDCSWRSMHISAKPLKSIIDRVHSHDQCQYFCRVLKKCSYWSYQSKKGKCSLFDNTAILKIANDFDYISGPKYCDGTCLARSMRINSESVQTMDDIETPEDCQNHCKNNMRCHGFNFIRSNSKCVLVKEGPRVFDSEVVSGDKRCQNNQRMKFVELRDCYDHGINYAQGDFIQVRGTIAPWECQLECQKIQRCRFWTFDQHCYLKTDIKGLKYVSKENVVSGPKYCLAYKQDVEITEGHFRTVKQIRSASSCHGECRNSTRCNYFSYNPLKSECHLKTNSTLNYKKNFVSGPKVHNDEEDIRHPYPIIPPAEDIQNCFSYGIKFETSGSVVEMDKMVDSVEMCHKYCKYRKEGCDYFVFYEQRRQCFLLQGELRRSRPCLDSNDCISGPSDCTDCFEHGLKRAGRIFNSYPKIHSPNHCQLICKEDSKCTSWHYDLKTISCHLYKSVDERKAFIGKNLVYGLKECGKTDSPYKPLITMEKSYLSSVCYLEHIKYNGGDIDRIERVYSSQECQKLCQALENCRFWSWNYETQICYRKNEKYLKNLVGKQNYFSGPRVCENCFREGVNLEADEILKVEKINSPRNCQILCEETSNCTLWTLIGRICHLRQGEIKLIHIESDAVSGSPECSFVLDYRDSVSRQGICVSDNLKYEGTPLLESRTNDYKECEVTCVKNPFCKYWTFNKEKKTCTLSNDRKATNFHETSFVSGEIECTQGCFEYNVNYLGKSVEVFSKIYRPEFCQYLCQVNKKCEHWTFIPFNSHCILKSSDIQQSFKRDYRTLYISGPKYCQLKELLEQNNLSCRNIGYSYARDISLISNDPENCSAHCRNTTECTGWTFESPNACHLAESNSTMLKDPKKISSPKTCDDCFSHGFQYMPPHFETKEKVFDAFDCQRYCTNATACTVFTFLFKERRCHLFKSAENSSILKGAISGPRDCLYESKANKLSRVSIDTINNRQHNRDVITIRNRETQLLEVKDRSTEWYQRHLSTNQLSKFISKSMADHLNVTSISYEEIQLNFNDTSSLTQKQTNGSLNLVKNFEGIIDASVDDIEHILIDEDPSSKVDTDKKQVEKEDNNGKKETMVSDGIITLVNVKTRDNKSSIEPMTKKEEPSDLKMNKSIKTISSIKEDRNEKVVIRFVNDKIIQELFMEYNKNPSSDGHEDSGSSTQIHTLEELKRKDGTKKSKAIGHRAASSNKNKELIKNTSRPPSDSKKVQYYIPIPKNPERKIVQLLGKTSGHTKFKSSKLSMALRGVSRNKKVSKLKANGIFLDDHIIQNGIQILLGDHNYPIEDINKEYDDYEEGCFAEGVRLIVPNVDVYSSLINPYQCAVVCHLHSECKGWTFQYKTKVCDIKGSFSSVDVSRDYNSVSGERSCKVDTSLL